MDKIERIERDIAAANKQIIKWTEKKKAAEFKYNLARLEEIDEIINAQGISWDRTKEVLREHGLPLRSDKPQVKEG